MAKNFHYFKFIATEWLAGDIAYEDFELQGIFINVCAIYWHRDGNVSFEEISKRLKSDRIAELTDRFISVSNGFISIKFLDEQLIEANHVSKTNSENGKKGGRPKAAPPLKEKPTANRPLSETKANESQIEIEIELNKNKVEVNNNRNTLSHEKVVSETLHNEIFCEEAAMTLKADYNVFVSFISDRLDEMKITGHSSKYPLGTIKNILIQDFKLNREKEKRSAKKENYGKSTSPTIGRTNEDAIKKFIADNRI